MSDENQIDPQQGSEQAAQQGLQINLQRIYTKDVSFETPNSPEIFTKEWQPEIKLDLDTRSNRLDDNGAFEVVLSVTVTATLGEQTAFLCEVQQAGVFTIAGEMPEVQLAHILGAYCPNQLFPYARETVSNLAAKGSFPNFHLAPVNFDAIFAQYMQQRAAEQAQAVAQAPSQLDS